jgi:hypothetical protein
VKFKVRSNSIIPSPVRGERGERLRSVHRPGEGSALDGDATLGGRTSLATSVGIQRQVSGVDSAEYPLTPPSPTLGRGERCSRLVAVFSPADRSSPSLAILMRAGSNERLPYHFFMRSFRSIRGRVLRFTLLLLLTTTQATVPGTNSRLRSHVHARNCSCSGDCPSDQVCAAFEVKSDSSAGRNCQSLAQLRYGWKMAGGQASG